MRAAAALGVEVAHTEFADFRGQVALVVERFDRVQLPDGSVQRIHQQDMCQALGRASESKYEQDGGPTAKDMGRSCAPMLRTRIMNYSSWLTSC